MARIVRRSPRISRPAPRLLRSTPIRPRLSPRMARKTRSPGGPRPSARRPRYRLRRGGYLPRLWDWRSPYPWGDLPIEDTDVIGVDIDPGAVSGELSQAARRTLRRKGLLSGVWRRRLADADPQLVSFINRFHHVAGMERVLEDLYNDPYRQAVARMAMRLSQRLASQDPDIIQTLHFDRRVGFAPDGKPILNVVAGHREVHYRFMPWKRLYASPIRAQLRRDALVFGAPGRIRWVFDHQRFPTARRLAQQLRQTAGTSNWRGARRWLAAIDRLIIQV